MTDLWDKAQENAESSELLIAHGHANIASATAYYAMFTAARVLLNRRAGIDFEKTRRHRSVMRLFSEHFVKTNIFDKDLGRAFMRASRIRGTADYEPEQISLEEATKVVEVMRKFLFLAKKLLEEHR